MRTLTIDDIKYISGGHETQASADNVCSLGGAVGAAAGGFVGGGVMGIFGGPGGMFGGAMIGMAMGTLTYGVGCLAEDVYLAHR